MQNFSQIGEVPWPTLTQILESMPLKLFLCLPYNKHLINRAKSVCMGESQPRSCVQTSLRSVCTYDLGQDSPIQTSCSVNKS